MGIVFTGTIWGWGPQAPWWKEALFGEGGAAARLGGETTGNGCAPLAHRLFFIARHAHNPHYWTDVILLPKAFFFFGFWKKQTGEKKTTSTPEPPRKEACSGFLTIIEFSSLCGFHGTLTLSSWPANPEEQLRLIVSAGLSKHFTLITSHLILKTSWVFQPASIILQMRKLRLRMVKWHKQSHTAAKCWSWPLKRQPLPELAWTTDALKALQCPGSICWSLKNKRAGLTWAPMI